MKSRGFSRVLCLGLTVLWGPACCHGQPTRQPLADRLRFLPGFSEASRRLLPAEEQNADVGVLEVMRSRPRPPVVSVGTYQTGFYTDNVTLSETDRQSSWGWNGSFGAGWIPCWTRRWTPSLAAEYLLVRYDRASPEDFNGQTFSVDSVLDLNEAKSWSWEVTYTLTRLEAAHGDTGAYYRDGVLYNGLNWLRPLDGGGQLYWLATVDVAWRHASPSEFDRVESALTLNLLYYPHARVRLAPFLQPSLYSYLKDTSTQDDRRDFNLNMGVEVAWYPRSEISLHATATWTFNYSDTPLQDYSVASPALSLFGSFWF